MKERFGVAGLWEQVKAISDIPRKIAAATTYCDQMWASHFSEDHTADVHMTATGLTGLVKSTVDGRFYRVVIEPYEDER